MGNAGSDASILSLVCLLILFESSLCLFDVIIDIIVRGLCSPCAGFRCTYCVSLPSLSLFLWPFRSVTRTDILPWLICIQYLRAILKRYLERNYIKLMKRREDTRFNLLAEAFSTTKL